MKKRTLAHSFRDAFRGAVLCFLSERNMRIHGTACGYVLFFAFKMGIDQGEMACLLLAMGLVTGAEAMNTAVEKLCDHVCREKNPEIGRVKDLAAGAVLLCAIFAALTGGAVLLRPEMWEVLADIVGTGWKMAAFGASVVGSLVLIFVVPVKRK